MKRSIDKQSTTQVTNENETKKVKYCGVYQIPSDLWIVVFGFLQTTKDFISLYTLTRELYEMKTTWKYVMKEHYFSIRNLTNMDDVIDSSISVVSKLHCTVKTTDYDLKHMSGVEDLCLFDSFATPVGFSHLKNLKSLRLINHVGLTDYHLKSLSGIEQLVLLGTGYWAPNGFESLTNLKRLRIGGVPILERTLDHLKNVEMIRLNGIWITDVGVANLKNIKCLHLTNCDLICDGLSGLEQLRVVSFTYGRITDKALSYMSRVEYLDLTGTRGFTDDGLRHLSSVLALKLSGCNQITDTGLVHLGGVHHLDLEECDVTDFGMKYLESVRDLSLKSCDKITKAGLDCLKSTKKMYCAKLNSSKTLTLADLMKEKKLDVIYDMFRNHPDMFDVTNQKKFVLNPSVNVFGDLYALDVFNCYGIDHSTVCECFIGLQRLHFGTRRPINREYYTWSDPNVLTPRRKNDRK